MKKLFTLLALVAICSTSMAQWLPQASGFTAASRGIQYMDAVDGQVVWATAYDGAAKSATINEFTRTINGGDLWTPGQVKGGNTYGIGNICGISGDIAYVTLFNGVGNQDNTCGIYKTSDGGTTWVQLPGALQGSASFANNVYFWNEQEGMCHGDVKDGYFEIYTTSNGGTTWTRVPKTSITGGTVASGEGGWTSVIEAVGENTIMFGTNKGKVYISNDRGLNWRISTTGITPVSNGGINALAFVDETHGLAVQTQTPVAVRRTADGGLTWETVTPTGSFLTNDLTSVPGSAGTYISTGAATGFTGISYSFDSGNTWTLFEGTADYQFLATDFVDNATGWAGSFSVSATEGGMYVYNGILEEPLPPANLNAVVAGPVVTLTWTAPDPMGSTFIGYKVWRNGTVIAPNITELTYIDEVQTNGGYAYMVTAVYENGESVPSNTVEVEITGIGVENIEIVKNLRVYPNPSNGILNLKADNKMNTVALVNLAGQVVFESAVSANETAINTSGISEGFYLLNITTDAGIVTRKVSIR
ncbi:MAG: T9SS type A sorting domain-containing protein [Lentimicrobiaceae bacterium]